MIRKRRVLLCHLKRAIVFHSKHICSTEFLLLLLLFFNDRHSQQLHLLYSSSFCFLCFTVLRPLHANLGFYFNRFLPGAWKRIGDLGEVKAIHHQTFPVTCLRKCQPLPFLLFFMFPFSCVVNYCHSSGLEWLWECNSVVLLYVHIL